MHNLPPVVQLTQIEETLQRREALMASVLTETRKVSDLHAQTFAASNGRPPQAVAALVAAAALSTPVDVPAPALPSLAAPLAGPEPHNGDAKHFVGERNHAGHSS